MNTDRFCSADAAGLESPLSGAALQNYIHERVVAHVNKNFAQSQAQTPIYSLSPAGAIAAAISGGAVANEENRKKALETLARKMAAHDGPPTKEEIEEHLWLKYDAHDAGNHFSVADHQKQHSKKLTKVDAFGQPLKNQAEDSWVSSVALHGDRGPAFDAPLSDSIGF